MNKAPDTQQIFLFWGNYFTVNIKPVQLFLLLLILILYIFNEVLL